MTRLSLPPLLIGTLLGFASLVRADAWDVVSDYSATQNPNGAWSYGRKWAPSASGFDLMAIPWGSAGWYMGNWGHGGPSIHGYVSLWPKDNSNGLPVVRWTSPRTDTYSLDINFTGNDSRGVDVYVFVMINNVQAFSQRLLGFGSKTNYAVQDLPMNAGDTIDLVVQWGGTVYSEYSWTLIGAVITDFTPPIEIGTSCGTPHLMWSGSPTIGDSYTVTTQNLGTSNQLLLVDWSNKTSKYRRIGGCPTYVIPDAILSLGNTASYTFAIPADPTLVGLHLRTQAVIQRRPSVSTQGIDAIIGD